MNAWLLMLLVAAPPGWQRLGEVQDWSGVYLQGRKVGYMFSTRTHQGNELQIKQRMIARVAGMGQNVEVEVKSEAAYDWTSGKLLSLLFQQSSQTGVVSVAAKANGDKLDITSTAGGASRAEAAQQGESAQTMLAGELLAVDPKAKVGQVVKVKVFDPSIMKVTPIEYTLAKIEKRVLDGVPVPVRHVVSKMTDLNVEEESIFSPDGHVLEAKVAGLFTMRLEDEQRAKDLDFSQDLLKGFVVSVDKPIADPYRLDEMKVSLSGAGNFALPTTERQVWERQGDVLRVSVKRTRMDESKAASLPVDASKFKTELQPEALLQSDAPEIRAMAKDIVGNEQNTYRAAKKLLDWVNAHVEKAYVPAVSNALEVFKSKKGDCGEHTVLFVALARAAGIPARPVVGITYWPPGNGFGYHAWAEVWVGQWLAVDPTQGTMSADATHIQLAGGDLSEQAKITMLIGKLKAAIEKTL